MDWRHVAKFLRWKMLGSRSRSNLDNRPIWSWKMLGTCISNFPHFKARSLNKKKLYLWRDLWDFRSWSSKDWHLVAQEFSLIYADHSPFNDIIRLIPQ